MESAAAGTRSSRLAEILALSGALLIALGAFPHWAYAKSAFDDGLNWPLTGDAFAHGYIFVAVGAIGIALHVLYRSGVTSIEVSWWYSIFALLMIGSHAIALLADADFDLEFIGPGLFISLGGSIAYPVGTFLIRQQERRQA
ncbi:MAG: hypothetical protein ACC652_12550 [Acidimicrobiales bacterium]